MPEELHFHADDFGMSAYSNEKITECIQNGALNGISLLPDGPELPSSLPQNVFCCIHLDLVEGKALSKKGTLSLLTDTEGYFNKSFLRLLLLSMSHKKKVFAAQLKSELRLQIEQILRLLPEGGRIGIDSHQHTHMIPLIFHTVLELSEELSLPLDYIRVPVEPILPFLSHPSLYRTYRPINIVKSLVLRTLFLFSKKDFTHSGITTQVFFGIVLSGNMDEKRVHELLPDFIKIARKRRQGLEVLFHPGSVPQAEYCMDLRKKGFVQFYLSDGRKNEYLALHSFKNGQERKLKTDE